MKQVEFEGEWKILNYLRSVLRWTSREMTVFNDNKTSNSHETERFMGRLHDQPYKPLKVDLDFFLLLVTPKKLAKQLSVTLTANCG